MSGPPMIERNAADLQNRDRSAPQRNPWWWLCGLVAAALISQVISQWNITVAVCGFRQLTGVPCPLCGGTRTMQSMASFEFPPSGQYNPLVFLAGLLIVGWAFLWTLDGIFGLQLLKRSNRSLQKLPIAVIAVGLILLNWVYLICVLE
jgi:hypothetical protein